MKWDTERDYAEWLWLEASQQDKVELARQVINELTKHYYQVSEEN